MTKIFEDKRGIIVDFFNTIPNMDPNNTDGTLFSRSGSDDCFFKLEIILNYFKEHELLRHEQFLQLVEDARMKKKQEEENEKATDRLDLINEVVKNLTDSGIL